MALVKQLLTSKKFLALLAGGLAWGFAKFNLDLTTDDLMAPLVLVASYIVGQGYADSGKEAVRLEAAMAEAEEE